jgi:hypothetical protein
MPAFSTHENNYFKIWLTWGIHENPEIKAGYKLGWFRGNFMSFFIRVSGGNLEGGAGFIALARMATLTPVAATYDSRN